MNVLLVIAGIVACSISAFLSRTEAKRWMRVAWYIGFVLAVVLIIIQGIDSEMSGRTIETMRGKLSDAEVHGRVAIINFEGSKSLSKDYSLPDS